MMQHLGRTYYVALLSAAERHGAAHQAPMGFQVMVEPPVLRDKERDGYVIRYAERRQIPMDYVERKEVPTGWLNVSSRELTAVDLIAYQDHVGGLTRAATVLEELALRLDFSRLDASFLKVAPAPVFQRLGYLLDRVLEEERLAWPDEIGWSENESRTPSAWCSGGRCRSRQEVESDGKPRNRD